MTLVEKLKTYLKRPSSVAFLVFAAVYAVALGSIFWGAWAQDKVPVAPDCQTTFAVDDAAAWFRGVLGGKEFIPSDLMHVVFGMYFWVELQFALAAFLAALGVAFYLRGRRCSRLACYGGGAAYGLMGYCFTLFSAGHLGWFLWLMYGPFAFGLVDRCVRKGKWRNWALLGAVLAWSSVRQPDLWLLFTLLTFAYGVWCLVRDRKTVRWGRAAAGVGLCVLATLLVGMPQYGHAIFHELAGREKQIAESTGGEASASAAKSDDPAVREKARAERWRFCTSWSLPPEDTLEFLVAEVHGGSNDPRIFNLPGNRPYTGRLGQQAVVPPGPGGLHPVTRAPLKGGETYWMPYRQHALYFGFLTLGFALAGVVGWALLRRRPQDALQAGADWSDTPFWIGAAALVYLCALGGFTPFYRLVFALPFGDQIRCPVKFVHLLEFCTAVLAGFGVEFLRARFGAGRAWVAPVLAAVLALNVFDLARVDAKYLAVQDVAFQRAANEAAADVAQLGGGKVFVAMSPQEGGRVVAESFGLHGVETVEDPNAPDIRFVVAGGTTLRDNKALDAQLQSGALKSAGMYTLSATDGVRRAEQARAMLALLQVAAVPAPAPKEAPAPDRAKQLLTLLSVLATCGIAGWGLAALRRRRG